MAHDTHQTPNNPDKTKPHTTHSREACACFSRMTCAHVPIHSTTKQGVCLSVLPPLSTTCIPVTALKRYHYHGTQLQCIREPQPGLNTSISNFSPPPPSKESQTTSTYSGTRKERWKTGHQLSKTKLLHPAGSSSPSRSRSPSLHTPRRRTMRLLRGTGC